VQQGSSMFQQPLHDSAKGVPASITEAVKEKVPFSGFLPRCLI